MFRWNSLYRGYNDYEKRSFEHNSGYDPKSYTFNRRPLELLYVERFTNIEYAIEFEKQIKGQSKKKKLAYIKESFDGLINYNKEQELLKKEKASISSDRQAQRMSP